MKILGISSFYHDSAACLVEDGRILSAVQEERFTRKKHDANFPKQAIQYCLENIDPKDIDLIAFYDKPFLKFERLLETYLSFAPKGISSFIQAMPIWLGEKLWIKDTLQKELSYSGKVLFPEHHASHAASAFFPSPFKQAAFLTMDGVGEWATTSFGIGKDNQLELWADIRFPHSLGLLYSAFTYYIGFKVNSGEYKLMGLAPYGEPKYTKLIFDELLDLKEDGSFRLNMKYFNYTTGLTMTNSKFHRLFGYPPRKPESTLNQEHMDIARSIQEVTEEIVLRMARHVHQTTKENNLCLAGGVALNCVANGRLLREGPFKEIWIQPAATDSGGSLGAALLAWYEYCGGERTLNGKKDSMQGSYLGPRFTSQKIEKFLLDRKIPHQKFSYSELTKKTAELIAKQKVIGWFQGRMEFGPRALGHRSILGDARSPDMQKTMNLKIKFRESFRPFAPTVLRETASHYFELEKESPYMLLVASVRKELRKNLSEEEHQYKGLSKLQAIRSSLPAITHVDYSARIQTIDRDTDSLFYQLLLDLDKNYDCSVIINTSFNVRGEPIVCTPEEAYLCFMRTHIDYLVLENYLLDKTDQEPLEYDENWQKEFEMD